MDMGTEEEPSVPQSSDYSTVDFMVEVIKPVDECQRGAKIGDLLTVHYNGSFANGSKEHFDSSHKRGQAFNFQLGFGEVIPGWEKGLLGICVGEIRRLTIPPHLGYGATGVGNVPPNAALVFDIEIVEIKDGAKPQNVFKEVDMDNNKKLTKEEVAVYFKKEAIRLNLNVSEFDISDMVWEVFKIDDRNKDGTISRREFSGPVKDEL